MSELEIDGNPGRGGVNRGRADAFLGLENENSVKAGSDEKELLKAPLQNAEPGDLLATETADPSEGPDADAVRGTAREGAEGEAEMTWKRAVPPRHRGVVRRYFESVTSRPTDR